MKKYNSKNNKGNISLLKRLKVYSKNYIKRIEDYLNKEENSLLIKKLYNPFYSN